MSVAVAEQAPTSYLGEDLKQQEFSDVYFSALDLPGEILARKRAERLERSVGSVAVEGFMEQRQPAHSTINLHEALIAASKGDVQARRMIETNVQTDIFERTVKTGFVSTVRQEVNEQGQIVQAGQTNEQIHANTLKFLGSDTKMIARFQAETRNTFRLENALRQGVLDDYWFVVISRCADDMTADELDSRGFFSPTKSMSVQATTSDENGVLTSTAFLAGVSKQGGPRHDYDSIKRFGGQIGVSFDGDATKTLDTPLLIKKSAMPNGVIDIVEMIDSAAGGTFFGESKPQGSYLEVAKQSEKRMREMGPKVAEITSRLIASASQVSSPIEASQLLDRVVGRAMVEVAVSDSRIDPRVFGQESAFLIQDARAHMMMGDLQRAQQATLRAQKQETSSSCPGGVRSESADSPGGVESEEGDSGSSSDKLEDCEFVSKQCPKCGAKNVKTVCKNGKYTGSCGCTSG